LKSDIAGGDEPTGSVPVVSPSDSRVTISGAEVAGEVVDSAAVDPNSMLPHWTEAPTGQVPIVVAREAAEAIDPWAAIPAPAWREGEADWVAHEDQFDASVLADDTPEATWTIAAPEVEAEAILEETPRPEPQREFRTRRMQSRDMMAGRAARKTGRSVSTATLTGIAMGVVVLVLFELGTWPVAILIMGILGLAAAEAYAVYRSVGAHPATILGIVGTVTVALAVFEKGPAAIGAVTFLMLSLGFVWYMNAERRIDVMDGLGATLFVYAWIGIVGSYGLAIVSPRTFPHHNGLTIMLGVIMLTAANDSGALFIGRAVGKRPLSPALSPNKTLEGALGGMLVTVIVSLVILPLMAPWGFANAFIFALVLSCVVPIGDLFESMVKRTLGVKDIGRILPGHGGILDRVDGLLFALPTAYYLAQLIHLK